MYLFCRMRSRRPFQHLPTGQRPDATHQTSFVFSSFSARACNVVICEVSGDLYLLITHTCPLPPPFQRRCSPNIWMCPLVMGLKLPQDSRMTWVLVVSVMVSVDPVRSGPGPVYLCVPGGSVVCSRQPPQREARLVCLRQEAASAC